MSKMALGIAAATTIFVTTVAASVPGGPMNPGWNRPWHGVAASATASQRKNGSIPHAPLLKTVLPGTSNLEVAVYETEYAPGGINPRHRHPAAITFHVVSGTGVWQEDGKPPMTLHAGDSLFVPAGTIHSHWNPSTTDHLRFLEFVVAEKDKGHSIPQPIGK